MLKKILLPPSNIDPSEMGLEDYFGLEKRWFSGSMVYMLVGGCLHDGCILYQNELWNIVFQYLKSPNALSFFRLFNPMFWPHATVLWHGVVVKETPNTAAICLVGEFEGILSTLRYPNKWCDKTEKNSDKTLISYDVMGNMGNNDQ